GLRHQGRAEREGQGWCRWAGRRSRGRRVAATLDAQAALVARRRKQMRTQPPTSVEATIRVLLMGWALHAGTTTLLRTLRSATAPLARTGVRSWRLSGLGLDTRRQQVQGQGSEARLQACLPRLRRFGCSRPRRRAHQETTVRAWLAQRAHAHS